MSRRPTPPPTPRDTRDALGLAPTRSASATSSAVGTPPVLRTGLWSGIKLLLLMNILPLCGVVWLAWGWWNGRVSLRRMTTEHVVVIIAVCLACALVAVSAWLVMPVARWLRDYPAWHFRNVGRVAWFLPMVGGWACWFALWVASLVAVGVATFVIATGLWRIAHGG